MVLPRHALLGWLWGLAHLTHLGPFGWFPYPPFCRFHAVLGAANDPGTLRTVILARLYPIAAFSQLPPDAMI